MTFDAAVFCNCFKEGKTKPFPLPELAQHFGWNEDMIPALNLPWNETTKDAHNIVENWKYSNPCEHNALAYRHVQLGTNKGYWSFHRMLEQIGWDHFPTLHSVLPKANGGYALARFAPSALAELDGFNNLATLGTDVALVDADTGDRIWERTGIWLMQVDKNGGSINTGIDKQGFFITPDASKKVRDQADFYKRALEVSNIKQLNPPAEAFFRAWRFTQKVLMPKPNPKVEFHNRDTDQRYISESAIQVSFLSRGGDVDDNRVDFPEQLVVQEYAVKSSDFAYIVQPLIDIFNASIETGNPVVWS